MTIEQIIDSVSAVTGGYSRPSFFRDRRTLKLKPSGIRQKPQQYPPAAVAAILAARGFESALAPIFHPVQAASSSVKLPSIGELKSAKRKAVSRLKGGAK